MTETGRPRNVSDLRQLEHEGRCPDFLFFWGHQPGPGGELGPGCLSQWWPAPFTIDGVTFPTAEHFMMVSKARLFGDELGAASILADPSPTGAKALGRAIRAYDDEVWAASRYGIVVEGNLAKFGQNPALLEYLIATGDSVLVEASPTDRVWGIGLAAGDEGARRPVHWKGMNLLGFALMDARDRLAEGTVAAARSA